MSIIKILDSLTTNQIAAGEVVERPSSVIKELCENSFDAGASFINVEIKNGGITQIKVTDNGIGMDKEDLRLAFLRHSTSKLNSVLDFETIKSFGFRGEALASIAAVSRVYIASKRKEDETGYFLSLEAGEIIDEGPVGCANGTKITVESLFYNTPARYKFLKKDFTEAGYIADIMERFALARADVSISLINNGKEILKSPGNNDLKSAIFSIYGKNITDEIIEVNYKNENLEIFGYAGLPSICRSNRQHQSIFVNDRYIKSSAITAALDEAYKTLLMRGKYPFCVLKINISPAKVDVNVHPQKIQVKFWNENEVFRSVYHSVQDTLLEKNNNNEEAGEEKLVSENNNQVKEDKITYEIEKTSEKTEQKDDINLKEEIIQIQIPVEHSQADTVIEKGEYSYQEEEQSKNNIDDLIGVKFVGILFNTYIVFEKADYMILIDQHAAHERILFEKLLEMNQKHNIKSQTLLEPEVIEMTPKEVLFFKEKDEIFKSLGFDCEEFGTSSIIVRAIPLGNNLISPSKAFKSVFDTVSNNRLDKSEIINEALFQIACKAAVKANDKLKDIEIDALIEEMKKTKRFNLCPHGRPTIIKVGKKEIEKWFKRIV